MTVIKHPDTTGTMLAKLDRRVFRLEHPPGALTSGTRIDTLGAFTLNGLTYVVLHGMVCYLNSTGSTAIVQPLLEVMQGATVVSTVTGPKRTILNGATDGMNFEAITSLDTGSYTLAWSIGSMTLDASSLFSVRLL